MPTSYTGSAGALGPADPVTVSNPDNGEGGTASSNDTAIKVLANFAKMILDKAGFLATARTWTAIQTFAETLKARGPSEYVAALLVDVLPTTKKLILTAGTGASKKLRLYFDANGQLFLTLNASWDGTNWNEDANAAHQRWIFASDGSITIQTVASGTATWADGTWTSPTGTLTVNAIQAATVASAGQLSAVTNLYVGTDADITDDLTVGDTLDVTGVATLHSTLGVTGRVTSPDHALTSSPASNAAPGANVLPATLIPKAWGLITVTGGAGVGSWTAAVTGGANVTVIHQAADVLRLTFPQPMTTGAYSMVFGQCRNGSGPIASPHENIAGSGKQAATCDLYFTTYAGIVGAGIDMDAYAGAIVFDFAVFGRQ